ncbi:MAG TPA: glycosyltransferase family 4 protein [Terriglobales bacterium]|nr:glycosyltransferase family 4 protein [Terriglobales bacterium]
MTSADERTSGISEPRVLHIVPALFGSDGVIGGAERYALELARHMAERVSTQLLTFGPESREEGMGNLRIRVIGRPHYVRGNRMNPLSWNIVREILRADVVHCHQQHVAASSMAAAISRITSRKVFVTELGGGGWDISSYLSTDRWYHGHLHISEYSRRVFGQEGQRRAHVILGGVDTEKFSPSPGKSRRDQVLFVGRLLPHKGIDDLIRAIRPRSVLPELRLSIIGPKLNDRYFADLQALAAGKPVSFRTAAHDDMILEAYRQALCLVLPSVYVDLYGGHSQIPELLGQTLLEAMACGTPAICTDVASMPEIVVDGVTGFVVPANRPDALREKLLWLQQHREQADVMGAAGRQRVLEKFAWPAVVERCLQIYGGKEND